MIITARVNNDKTYRLVRWNALEFNANLTLVIQSTDLDDVRNTFETIDTLEIFKEQTLVATYNQLDTFSSITFLGKEYVEGEGRFADALSVGLTKANIAEQIKRLDDQINPVIDPNTMDIEELRNYKLKTVSEACTADVYKGTSITLSDGTSKMFTYDMYDQLNYDELFLVCIMAPEVEVLPYHGSKNFCELLSRNDIITICSTLMLRKTQIITYANSLNMYIRSLSNRDELLGVQYGMELPQEYEDRISQIMGTTITEMEKFINKITPADSNEE